MSRNAELTPPSRSATQPSSSPPAAAPARNRGRFGPPIEGRKLATHAGRDAVAVQTTACELDTVLRVLDVAIREAQVDAG